MTTKYHSYDIYSSANITVMIFVLSLLTACASNETKRERLQADFPECFVTHELEIICQTPD